MSNVTARYAPPVVEHTVSTVVIVDEDGQTYTRTYVGMCAVDAIVDFTTLVDVEVASVEAKASTACYYKNYGDYIERYCSMCEYV